MPPEAFEHGRTYELEVISSQDHVVRLVGTFWNFHIDRRGCWMFFNTMSAQGSCVRSINYKKILQANG